MTRMKPTEFAKYLARDLRCPCSCFGREDTFVPQHRAGRGMGGSKAADRPSNIIVLCSKVNGLIESDAGWAETARVNGWKISRQDDPLNVPVYDRTLQQWFYLRDDYTREEAA